MALLIIEGDPGSISDLVTNSEFCGYLYGLFYEVKSAPDVTTHGKWLEFLTSFEQLIEDFEFLGLR